MYKRTLYFSYLCKWNLLDDTSIKFFLVYFLIVIICVCILLWHNDWYIIIHIIQTTDCMVLCDIDASYFIIECHRYCKLYNIISRRNAGTIQNKLIYNNIHFYVHYNILYTN